MVQVHIDDAALRQAATAGMDNFLEAFAGAIREAIGGELNADNMGELNSDQITLLGYLMLRDSVMDGGFVELIHNGLGEFIFLIPLARRSESGDCATCISYWINVAAISKNTVSR